MRAAFGCGVGSSRKKRNRPLAHDGIVAHLFALIATLGFLRASADSAESWFPLDARPLVIAPAILLGLWWLLALLSWHDGFIPSLHNIKALSRRLWRNRERVALTLAALALLTTGAWFATANHSRHRNCLTYTFPDGSPAANASVTFDYDPV